MTDADRWQSNWKVVSPSDSARVVLRRARGARSRRREAAELPIGTPVVLMASGPGAGRRSRRFAAGASISLEREYLAFPSAAAPAYLIEDSSAAVRIFVTQVLVAPPGTRLSAVIDAAIAVLRASSLWRLVRALAPGRVSVGRRA